ncbi:hypothetical protein [Dyella sp. C9]|uniref:hypothetical protein n=1 Tax=Dyella sp. C9 TaxID=2202154 RepID=UPI0013008D53|nr:hypothetical protein [Dyella sp. C9]
MTARSGDSTRHALGLANIGFVAASFLLALVAHALAYLSHEYAHSVMAWSLGWMERPFDIDYGPPSVYNFIFLGDVSDNVSYAPIFAAGHGISAAVIAFAGPFLGNGLLYFLLYAVVPWLSARSSAVLPFIYWLSLMCAANVWSYVPIRAITTHADIALIAQGLGTSCWALFPVLMLLSGFITWHFFVRMFPKFQGVVAAKSSADAITLIAFTAFWYFSFFGGDGIGGSYGLVSQLLSITSRYFLFPLCVAYLSVRYLPLLTVGNKKAGSADEVP